MIRQSPRLLFRSSPCIHTTPTRRFLSTAPPARKSRSWKSYTARLALAFGAVYYYNTSQLFAEEPPFSIPPPQSPTEEPSLQTLESLAIKNRTPPPPTPYLATSHPSQNVSPNSKPPISEVLAPSHPPKTVHPNPMPSTPEDLEATEEEASQEGAFNEVTGEINWDCPCLGGMAHGPCGEQFRAAFGCFVYSKDEPKGMDCIPNFKNMQDCFREHPDVYGAELDDDDDEGQGAEDAPAMTPAPAPVPFSVEGGEVPAAEDTRAPAAAPAPVSLGGGEVPAAEDTPAPADAPAPVSVEGGEVPAAAISARTAPAPSSAPQSLPSTSSSTSEDGTHQGSTDEGNVLVPKAAHDATAADTRV